MLIRPRAVKAPASTSSTVAQALATLREWPRYANGHAVRTTLGCALADG
ncbi:hypothetical protein [Moorena producens]